MSTLPPTFAETGLHLRPTDHVITRFQVVGERSSGTNYIKRLFGKNTGLRPVETLGWKHGGMQTLAVPADYSADLETGTVNGGIELDFPVTVQGRLGKRLAAGVLLATIVLPRA